MRILVVGAGGTGGFYGGRLLQAGRDVTFLVRPKRAAQLRERGLEIVSPHGDATLQPTLVGAADIAGPYDLVFLSVKAYALAAALEDCAPAVGPMTLVLPVLNGMRHIDTLTARFGQAAVLGGVSQIAATVDDAGRVVQLTDLQKLAYGERRAAGPQDPARIAAVHAAMEGVQFEARAAEDIDLEMWEKWVFLATLGGITCLMRGTVGDIESVPGGTDLTRQFLAEAVAVAQCAGHAPRAPFLAQAEKMLTAPGSPLASSMYRDLQRGQEVEADQIIGDLLARARGHGTPTALLASADAHLRVYQAVRARR